MIAQTLRHAKNLSAGREVLARRITALAAAQTILTGKATSAIQLTEVVKAALWSPRRESRGSAAC